MPFGDKVLEKVVVVQLQGCLEEADYLDSVHFGFMSGHDTETALVFLADDSFQKKAATQYFFMPSFLLRN